MSPASTLIKLTKQKLKFRARTELMLRFVFLLAVLLVSITQPWCLLLLPVAVLFLVKKSQELLKINDSAVAKIIDQTLSTKERFITIVAHQEPVKAEVLKVVESQASQIALASKDNQVVSTTPDRTSCLLAAAGVILLILAIALYSPPRERIASELEEIAEEIEAYNPEAAGNLRSLAEDFLGEELTQEELLDSLPEVPEVEELKKELSEPEPEEPEFESSSPEAKETGQGTEKSGNSQGEGSDQHQAGSGEKRAGGNEQQAGGEQKAGSGEQQAGEESGGAEQQQNGSEKGSAEENSGSGDRQDGSSESSGEQKQGETGQQEGQGEKQQEGTNKNARNNPEAGEQQTTGENSDPGLSDSKSKEAGDGEGGLKPGEGKELLSGYKTDEIDLEQNDEFNTEYTTADEQRLQNSDEFTPTTELNNLDFSLEVKSRTNQKQAIPREYESVINQ